MAENHRIPAQCTKLKYDELGAKMALARLRKRRKRGKCESRYYWCKSCQGYHLTSKRQ